MTKEKHDAMLAALPDVVRAVAFALVPSYYGAFEERFVTASPHDGSPTETGIAPGSPNETAVALATRLVGIVDAYRLRDQLDALGYQKVFNAIADAVTVLPKSGSKGISVEAFISAVTGTPDRIKARWPEAVRDEPKPPQRMDDQELAEEIGVLRNRVAPLPHEHSRMLALAAEINTRNRKRGLLPMSRAEMSAHRDGADAI